jgi:hypothetical protein
MIPRIHYFLPDSGRVGSRNCQRKPVQLDTSSEVDPPLCCQVLKQCSVPQIGAGSLSDKRANAAGGRNVRSLQNILNNKVALRSIVFRSGRYLRPFGIYELIQSRKSAYRMLGNALSKVREG